MGNSKVTAHYWRHKCPANNPEDGDDVSSNHPDVKYSEIPLLGRFSSKPWESILGKKCTADGCKYVVNEETVLLNKYKEKIQNIGGKNLYPGRTDPSSMKCCHWSCNNATTRGHGAYVSTFREPGGHYCSHALAYQRAIQDENIEGRLPGCTCVMLNAYKEPVETWEPQRRGVPVPGGPLDLDNKYHERKEKEVME
jgi:hypothetical protein